jgi:hypothetical protein
MNSLEKWCIFTSAKLVSCAHQPGFGSQLPFTNVCSCVVPATIWHSTHYQCAAVVFIGHHDSVHLQVGPWLRRYELRNRAEVCHSDDLPSL